MLGDLRPQGTINLERGSVNLFTTQFELERATNKKQLLHQNKLSIQPLMCD
ncbi:MAG: hypothetical protein CLLPBCKN_008202 [Chroococcidiopsis cubana SAG 39.79]|nr:hypothetical protein [Chroococcidiopsis cubana SAG 39.79]